MRLPLLLQRVLDLGHIVFEAGDYNLNIIGIRSEGIEADRFDDWLTCTYKVGDAWVSNWWSATTDPGLYYLGNKAKWLNANGVAVLAPGQYRASHQLGPHGRTKYEALVQRGVMKVYRDSNLDEVVDMVPATMTDGLYGINIHAATMSPYEGTEDKRGGRVGAWSAGCQVFAREVDFQEFMKIVKVSAGIYGPTFTYTLVTESELRKTWRSS